MIRLMYLLILIWGSAMSEPKLRRKPRDGGNRTNHAKTSPATKDMNMAGNAANRSRLSLPVNPGATNMAI